MNIDRGSAMNHSTDKPAMGHLFSEPDYHQWLLAVKQRIHAVRMRIALAANGELIAFYYEIGAQIVEREAHAHWGSGFIDALSKDLRASFPDIGGFSSKNLRYCRAFFRFYCAPEIWQQAVAKLDVTPWAGVNREFAELLAQIPWGHNILVFTKSADLQEARFYLRQTLENGWNRDVLALQIKSGLYARAGKAITNFQHTLPPLNSDLAQQTLKDPYWFDFMTMATPYNERDIEN
jgi:predicted nuclease of restriction endonuclease-like (RecB) superfamily